MSSRPAEQASARAGVQAGAPRAERRAPGWGGTSAQGTPVSAPTRIVRAGICQDPVSVHELAALVRDRAAGAVVTFEGAVRDHDGGRGVTGIGYTAHPSASEVLSQIATEVAARRGLRALGVVHRVGDLQVGDTALAVAVSADHRAEAFAAAGDLVEEVKKRLPVWKRQFFADGSAQWTHARTGADTPARTDAAE